MDFFERFTAAPLNCALRDVRHGRILFGQAADLTKIWVLLLTFVGIPVSVAVPRTIAPLGEISHGLILKHT